jgi:general secretion pathway protein K
MTASPRSSQAGVVLLVVMWTIVLLSTLVLTLAAEVRLSAAVSKSQVDRTNDWADTLTALNAAEMELLFENMPPPAEDTDPEDDDDVKNPDYRFNGEPLDLAYAQPDSVEVRIYDHAGKINLRNLTEDGLQTLLEKQMEQRYGDVDDDELAELLAAWGDWLDEDDGVRNDGAEDEYYESLDPPYRPRNGDLESVEEILLIRGFDKYFGDVNLAAAFTLYSDSDTVNLNMATPEALALLPGLDDAEIEAILAYRRQQDFTQLADLDDIVDEDDVSELQSWIDFTGVSPVYTILVVPKRLLETADGEAEARKQPTFGGFAAVVRANSYTERPFTLRIDPIARLPRLN